MTHTRVPPPRSRSKDIVLVGLAVIGAGLLSATPAASQAGDATPPPFEAYLATETFRGTPVPPKLDRLTIRPAYRPIIHQEAKDGPNFAGAYTVVTYGCGTGCQVVLVINARTGKVHTAPAAASYGVSYRRKSRLLVFNADPVNRIKAQYFVFHRGKFRQIR